MLYDRSTDTLPYISYECIGNEVTFIYTILNKREGVVRNEYWFNNKEA